MAVTETLDIDNALQAWKVAEFPLVVHNEKTQWVSVLNPPHGTEGLLPVSLFAPTAFDLSNPDNACRRIVDIWVGNIHVESVLERHLGEHGARAATHILGELAILAANRHRATVAYSAARIVLGADTTGETLVSLWDNGRSYGSFEAIETGFSEDAFGNLSEPYSTPATNNYTEPWPTLVVQNTTGVFGGSLTVISGAARVDIGKGEDGYTFTHHPAEAIQGNLVIARLPHQSS